MPNPVWMVMPSRNQERAEHTLKLWRDKGYKVSIFLEPGMKLVGSDLDYQDTFPGYWMACNLLCNKLVEQGVDTIVLAADDLEPEQNKSPEEIRKEIYEKYSDGYCVMQPTGDDKNGMDGVWRICGSPWFGIGWIKEAFEGRGPCPLPPFAFYGDELLFNVAKLQGVLWQRNDLSQFHNHWCRTDSKKTKRTDYQISNSNLWWDKDQKWFFEQRDTNFHGCGRKITGWLP